MLKQIIFMITVLCSTRMYAGEDSTQDKKPVNSGAGLELKLTSHTTHYAIDRGGKTAEEYAVFLKKGNAPYGPAVVIMVELRNTGDKDFIAYGAPRPQFILKGPRSESVREVAPTQFQSAPSRRYVLGAGKSAFLNVISFFNPDKDEPSVKDTIKRLSYSDGTALQCVNWTEPGEYTLSAVISLGVSPAPAGAKPFEAQKFAFNKLPDDIGLVKLESNAVKLTIREGNEVDYWSNALEDPDAEVRFVAAHTLTAALPLAEATRIKMAARVHDTDTRVRKSAARALQRPAGAKIADADVLAKDPAILALVDTLKDPNAGVRAFGVTALATWGNPVTTFMLPLLRDSDASVRLATAEALTELFRGGARQEKTAVPELIAVLKDSDERIVRAALKALGIIKAPDAVPALIPFCKSGNPAISRAAIEALGNTGRAAHDAEETLLAALKTDDTRKAAAEALGKIGADPKKLLPALIVALNTEEDGFGRVSIVRALGSCGTAAEPALRSALKNDKEAVVREYAEITLAAIGSKAESEKK